MDRVARALGLATELADGERLPERAAAARRAVAIGDPQAHADKLFAVLDHHGLLGDDGRLRDDVQLVSIGDHFDFGTRAQATLDAARVDGPRFLRWLCAHPPAQTTVLVGNHDTARVMELAAVTDARFDAAAALAGELITLKERAPEQARERLRDEYMVSFPEVPTLGIVHRDFSAFTEAQRALVQRELLAGRLRLAAAARAEAGFE
ncbi:MAG: metallophosphoesterase, partial [Deltaproteobacteria bacterium]|nr:metallophosphoesterase [Kofleriaceae bacterium]